MMFMTEVMSSLTTRKMPKRKNEEVNLSQSETSAEKLGGFGDGVLFA